MNPALSKTLMGLMKDLVFVFGSNRAGVHGAGAAKAAMQWGAKYGKGKGLMGRSYAIPTKQTWRDPGLPLVELGEEVSSFGNFAIKNPKMPFLVTPIGTGRAGHSVEDIASLFKNNYHSNIILPKQFREVLKVEPNELTTKLFQKLMQAP